MVYSIRHAILCLCLLINVGVVCAHDIVSERAWVEDPANNMTLADVARDLYDQCH